jgi:hypothetical protein
VILLSLLDKALKFMPRTFITATAQARVRNLRDTIRDALPRMKKREHDDYVFLNEATEFLDTVLAAERGWQECRPKEVTKGG